MSRLRSLAARMAGGPDAAFVAFGALGVALAGLVGTPLALRVGEPAWVTVLLLGVGVATIVGFGHLSRRVVGAGGLTFYQHVVAFLLLAALVLGLLGRPVLAGLDLAALMTAVFQGVGRLGCFSVGCCHGRPHPHGVAYPARRMRNGLRPHLVGVPLLPVQLVEAALVLAVAGACAAVMLTGSPAGAALGTWGVLYPLVRLSTEELRGDADRPYLAGLSEAQWTSLGLLAGVAVLEAAGALPTTPWHLWLGGAGAAGTVAWIVRGRGSRSLLRAGHLNELARVAAGWTSARSRWGGTAPFRFGPVRTGRGMVVSGERTAPSPGGVDLVAFSSVREVLDAGSAGRLAPALEALFGVRDARLLRGREAVWFLVAGAPSTPTAPRSEERSHGV